MATIARRMASYTVFATLSMAALWTSAESDQPLVDTSVFDVTADASGVSWTCPGSWHVAAFIVERLSPTDQKGKWVVPPIPGADGKFSFDVGAAAGLDAIYSITTSDVRGNRICHGPFAVRHTAALTRAAVSAEPVPASPSPDSTGQPGYKVKVSVSRNGVHYLDSATIADNLLGYTQGDVEIFIAATNMRVTRGGADVAWFSDDADSGIYFYAEGTNTRYTTRNEYWITPQPGLAMVERVGSPPLPGDLSLTYTDVIHREQDVWDRPMSYFDKPEADFWVWQWLHTGYPAYQTATMDFVVDSIPSLGGTSPVPATVSVLLKGGDGPSREPGAYRAPDAEWRHCGLEQMGRVR